VVVTTGRDGNAKCFPLTFYCTNSYELVEILSTQKEVEMHHAVWSLFK
jgi:hypothetical protein